MNEESPDKMILVLVSHHNAIHEFMRIFGRQEHVVKKPIYCWTGVIELELDKNDIDESLKTMDDSPQRRM
jgi:hypothetical protein